MSTNNPLISVIVPIYNVEEYLDDCIKSIINQTYENLEIILVNDGSTDQSLQICKRWERKDKRIFLVNKTNGGLSSARNAGLDVAHGEYFSFIDSDDQISRLYIEHLYKIIRKYSAQIVSCLSTNDINLLYQQNSIQIKDLSKMDPLLYYLSEEGHAVWNKLYDSSSLLKFRFEVGEQNEDILYSFQVFNAISKYVKCEECLYYWNMKPGSLSRSGVKDLKNQSRLVAQIVKDENKSEDVINAAMVRSAQFTYRTIARTLRFGFANDDIKKQFYASLDDYISEIKNTKKLIMKSSIFRRIDKFNVSILCFSYKMFCCFYIVEQWIRKMIHI